MYDFAVWGLGFQGLYSAFQSLGLRVFRAFEPSGVGSLRVESLRG